ncbi:hypothetical protein GN316_03115 [Xylophilus sp. Kf1]|nr:hypothetical protein [Xylophilus sp. Kf1]
MSRIFQTDQGTKVAPSVAGQRVSMVISKSVFVFSETMAPHDAAALGRELIRVAEIASGALLAAMTPPVER